MVDEQRNRAVVIALWIIIAAALGSIPFGYLLSRARGIDIRNEGSGNIGATNVARVHGAAAGVIILVLDAAKGGVPTWYVAHCLAAPSTIVAATGMAAILGHCFSPWLGFRGGKGVASALGVFVVIAPYASLIGVGMFVAMIAITRVVALGSIAGTATVAAALVWRGDRSFAIFGVITLVLIIYTHRTNLANLAKARSNKS